jgi:glutaminyl-peptide cyclotransferase
MKKLRVYLAVFVIVIAMIAYLIPFNSCNGNPPPPPTAEIKPVNSFQTNIVTSTSHDTSSFTEGFVFYKGFVYESTGLNGKSKLLKIDPKTWQTVKEISLDSKYFGEGIAILRDTIYQLTYQEHAVFLYDLNLNKKGEKYFDTDTHEGWGMTTDGTSLIVSDGSSNIQYFDPASFKLLKRVTVTEGGYPIAKVNELELIDGYLYANQWMEKWIYKIDPTTGQVLAKSDISNIETQTIQNNPDAVPNGIAYDSAAKKIYITGKYWPRVYEVKFQ